MTPESEYNAFRSKKMFAKLLLGLIKRQEKCHTDLMGCMKLGRIAHSMSGSNQQDYFRGFQTSPNSAQRLRGLF